MPSTSPSSVPRSAAPTASDDAPAVGPPGWAATVLFATTITIQRTFGRLRVGNTSPLGYATKSYYQGGLCSPDETMRQEMVAAGVCQPLLDRLGRVSSVMTMVGSNGKTLVRRDVEYADNFCIYEVGSSTNPAMMQDRCYALNKGQASNSVSFSPGSGVPAVSSITPTRTSPVVKVYGDVRSCYNDVSVSQVHILRNGDCVTMPALGSMRMECSVDGGAVNTTFYSDTACTAVAYVNATSMGGNPQFLSAPSTCSEPPLPRKGPSIPFVFTA